MLKIADQNTNWKTVKQTAKIGQKILRDNNAAGINPLVPGVNNSGLRNSPRLDQE